MSSSRWLRFLCGGAVTVGLASPTAGQDLRVRAYHGASGSTRAISLERDDGTVTTSRNRFEVTIPVDAEICIEVDNAHGALYRYALSLAVDTTGPKPPDLTAIVAQLNTSLTTEVPPSAQVQQMDTGQIATFAPGLFEALQLESWQEIYRERTQRLTDDLKSVLEAVRRSDTPEPLPSPVRLESNDDRVGYQHVRRTIQGLEADSFKFNDPKLKESIDALNATTLTAVVASGSQAERLTHELMSKHFAGLLAQRDALKQAYASSSGAWSACKKAERGVNTIHLSVERLDTAVARARDVGAELLTIVATTEYTRPLLEIIPVVLGARQSDVAELSVTGGVLALDEDSRFSPRAGSAILLNALRWGDQNEISLGPLLGIGLGGEGKAFSDFYVGAAFAVRDWFHVGAAWGQSIVAHQLKDPSLLGKELGETGELSELLDTEYRDAFYIIFNIFGLTLFDKGG